MNPDDLITAQEAAALLKCSLKTLYRLRKSGELKFTRPSWGSVRYRRGDVEALRKDQTGLKIICTHINHNSESGCGNPECWKHNPSTSGT